MADLQAFLHGHQLRGGGVYRTCGKLGTKKVLMFSQKNKDHSKKWCASWTAAEVKQ
jgi:hypothetical protein